jgi:antitoxin component YwqK of YwqJK toxin-antitoxin module
LFSAKYNTWLCRDIYKDFKLLEFTLQDRFNVKLKKETNYDIYLSWNDNNDKFEIDFIGQNINDVGILMFFERARAEMYLLESKENGYLVRWRDDGTKYCEENYINYSRNGLCKYYYISGIIKEEADYTNNYKRGIEKLYNEKGVLIKTKDNTPPPINFDHYKT